MKITKIGNSTVFEFDSGKKIIYPLQTLFVVTNNDVNTLSFKLLGNSTNLFSVDYRKITEPSVTSVDDAITKIIPLLN